MKIIRSVAKLGNIGLVSSDILGSRVEELPKNCGDPESLVFFGANDCSSLSRLPESFTPTKLVHCNQGINDLLS